VVASYAFARRAPGRPARRCGSGFAIGQIYVLARLWVKLTFWASETALFQSRLGHAGYVTGPSRCGRVAAAEAIS
jgi:hypothetical protein